MIALICWGTLFIGFFFSVVSSYSKSKYLNGFIPQLLGYIFSITAQFLFAIFLGLLIHNYWGILNLGVAAWMINGMMRFLSLRKEMEYP